VGDIERKAENESSTRVILLDEPRLGNAQATRLQVGENSMPQEVADPEGRLRCPTAVVPSRDPGDHRHADAPTAQQGEESDRSRPLVVVAAPRQHVDPSVFGRGEPRHGLDHGRCVVDIEVQPLDLAQGASHKRSIAVEVPRCARPAATEP